MDPKPTVLFDFTKARDIERWHVFSDAFFGGRSQAEWRAAPDQVRAALTLHTADAQPDERNTE